MKDKQSFKAVLFITIIILIVFGIVYIFLHTQKQQSVDTSINNFPVNNQIDSNIDKDNQPDRKPIRDICVGEFCDGSGIDDGMPQDFTVVQVPLIKDGGDIGCGVGVFFAPHVVEPKTSAVLDATYKTLFDLKRDPEIKSDNVMNPIADYTKLFYQSVSIQEETAKVMLTGQMIGPGHCSLPAIREQINQPAFQFDTVKKIEVYLNGKIFDWCSQSEADITESKCDKIPQYWIDMK